MSKVTKCTVVLAMMAVLAAGPALAAPPPPDDIRIFPPFVPLEHPWPMVNHDYRHSGLSPANTSRTADHLKWVYDTGGDVGNDASPVIDSAGTIYLNSLTGLMDGKLFAIKPDGKLKWAHPFANHSSGTPAIDSHGTIYVRTHSDRRLVALNPDGSEKWSVVPNYYPKGSPIVGPDGTILTADDIGHVNATNRDGTMRWGRAESAYSYSSPTATDDGKHVYWPHIKNLVSINYTGGWTEWDKTFSANNEQPNIATVDPEGTVYYGAANIYAVRADGTLKWQFTGAGAGTTAPAIGPDDNIYISSGGSVVGIRRDNQKMWSYATGDIWRCSPAISADGTIFVGAADGKLHAIRPDGTPRWVMSLGSDALTSPAIGADGTVYIASVTGKLYAVGAEFEPPSAPQELVAKAGPGSVSLSWQPPSSDGNATVTAYTVHRGVSNGTGLPVFLPLKTLGTVTAYNDTNVTNGVSYKYYITAKNPYGESKGSASVPALPMAPPSPPLNLAAKAGNRQVKLTWAAPASNGGGNVTGFRIYRGLAGGNLTFLAEVGNVLNYTDAGVQNGKTYTYQITAENAAGESAPPAGVNAGPKVPPAAKAPGFGAAALLAAIIGMAFLMRRPGRKD